jgi:hypothetical protein
MRRYMRKSYSNLKFPGVDNIFFILIGHYFGREVFLNPFSAYRWINAFAYFFNSYTNFVPIVYGH